MAKRQILNCFMTISGGTVDEQRDCARQIENSAKRIATKRRLRVQVALDQETEEE